MKQTPHSVGAILITRGLTPLLRSVLRAVSDQTVAPHSLTVIDVVDPHHKPLPAEILPREAELVRVGHARNLADAIRRAYSQGAPFSREQWWWILHEDSAPEPECLNELLQAGTLGKTVGAVGAKQLSWDGRRLLELGIFATASARRLERVGEGEIDQGQYDGTTDVLAVGTAGMLLRAQAYDAVGGFDTALGPFGDGLDMGRRLHLAGYRVVVAPRARLRHARLSLRLGLDPHHCDDADEQTTVDASFRKRRYAQMYNWCKAVPLTTLPALMVALLVWTPLRALGRVLTGNARLSLPEIAALVSLIGATPRLLAARARAARTATVPRATLRPLETTRSALRKEPTEVDDEDGQRLDPLILSSTQRYRVRSAATSLALLLVTTVIALIQWWGTSNGLVGGAWVGLPREWTDLWASAWSAWIPGGDGHAGPADPLTILMALLSGPLVPLGITPQALATFLLLASTPIVAMAAWLPSRSLTSRLPQRFLLALAWSLSPALIMSATHGVLAATIAHAVFPAVAAYCLPTEFSLPVLGATGVHKAPAHSRRPNAGAAALGVLILACCVPWTLIPLALTLAWRSRRRILVALPALVVLAPTYLTILTQPGSWAAIASTSGGVHAYTRAPSWLALLSMPAAPTSALEGIALSVLGATPVLLGTLTVIRERSFATASTYGLSLVATATGWAASQIGIGLAGPLVASAWTSPALSFSYACLLILSARLGNPQRATDPLDSQTIAWDTPSPLRHRLALATLCLTLLSGGNATALAAWAARAQDASTPTFTLSQQETVHALTSPIVSAVGTQAQRSLRAGRVLVLDGDPTRATVNAFLWRSSGPSLTDSSPAVRADSLTHARAAARSGALDDPATASLAQAAYTLVVYPDDATVTTLAAHGIDTILVPHGASGANALAAGLDRAGGLEKVGDTDSGTVWRVRPNNTAPSRVRIHSANGDVIPVGASQLHVDGTVSTIGTLTLAERADANWHATLDGIDLTPTEAADGWSQAYTLPVGGHLIVTYSPRWLLPWRIAASLCLLAATGAALTAWRRK